MSVQNGNEHKWTISSITAAFAGIFLTSYWFYIEPGYEPLGVLVACLLGAIILWRIRRTRTSWIIDSVCAAFILVITIAGFISINTQDGKPSIESGTKDSIPIPVSIETLAISPEITEIPLKQLDGEWKGTTSQKREVTLKVDTSQNEINVLAWIEFPSSCPFANRRIIETTQVVTIREDYIWALGFKEFYELRGNVTTRDEKLFASGKLIFDFTRDTKLPEECRKLEISWNVEK